MTKVLVYSKPQCVQCDQTKRYLKRQGVEYDEIDVTANADAYDYVVGKGYLQVPVVVTPSGEHWSGFRPDLLAGLS